MSYCPGMLCQGKHRMPWSLWSLRLKQKV